MNNVILEIKNLCKQYPEFELTNFNLELYEGEIVGFIGPNGSGYSLCRSPIQSVHDGLSHSGI